MPDVEQATERTHLLARLVQDRRLSAVQHETDAGSTISTHVSKEEQLLSTTSIGERLPYNDYTTIDWLHDLVSRLKLRAVYSTANKHRSKTRTDRNRYKPWAVSEVP